MANRYLDAQLRLLVEHFGDERVDRSLQRIVRSERPGQGSRHILPSSRMDAPRRARKSRPKPTATQYVSKMALPDTHRRLLAEAAEKFEEKAFLPTVGDVRSFFELHGFTGSASGSRAHTVPRIFKFLATMNTDDLRRTLDSGMFAGPARLGPIAAAIRDVGRERILQRTSPKDGSSAGGRRSEARGLAARAD